MLSSSAFLSNVPVVIWGGGEAPTKQVLAPTTPNLAHIDSLFKNPAKIRELASKQESSGPRCTSSPMLFRLPLSSMLQSRRFT